MWGQTPDAEFEHLSVGDGLSNGEVHCILEDRRGYLWIGTADGLNRYDGYGFRVFRHSRSDSTSLGDSHINSLFMDRSGTIWVGTRQGGLCRYNAEDTTFERFTSKPGVPTSLGEGAVNAIYEDRSGTLWVVTSDGGLNRFDRGSRTFRRYHADPADPHAPRSNNLGPMYDDGRGTLWIGSWAAGLHAFNLSEETFEQYGKVPPRDTLGINGIAGVLSIYPDPSGKLWLGTRRQLNLFDPFTKSFEPVLPDRKNPGLISRAVTAVLIDRFNTLWVGTYFDGLILVDLHGGIGDRFVHYRYGKDRREEGWIPNSKINALHEDSRGNVWVGTDDGLLKASRNRNRFHHLRHVPSDPSSLPDDRIRSIYAGRGDSLWIATGGGGLVLHTRHTGSVVRYRHDPGNSASIGGDIVNGIVGDTDGSLWLALDGEGMNHFFPRTGKFVRFKSALGPQDNLRSNWIFSISRTPDGRVWLGSNEGLVGYEPLRDSFAFFGGMGDNSIRAIMPTSDGFLWCGTYGNGLYCYAPATGEVGQFTKIAGDSTTLSNNMIRVVYEARDKSLWVGTFGGGLNRLDPSTRKFSSFDETDGLAGDVVEGIMEDLRGVLWVSTNKGLSRLDAKTGRFHTYGVADGLPTTRFQGQGGLLPSGELAFGTFSEGVVIFKPEDLVDNPAIPTVLLTGLRKYGSEENLLKGGEMSLTLSHSDNNFTVEFLSLDCTAPQNNRYAYLLEGLTPGWVDCGTIRSVEFTQVPPGDYSLRVRGSNNDGVWGEISAPLRISILPPFWGTWWFLVIASIAVAGALFGLHRYRVSRLIEIERLRMRIAGDLHDDLGSNLSGIALMSDLAVRGAGSDEERERLDFISRTARQMADTIKDLAWVVNPGQDMLDNLALRMKDTAAAMLGQIEHTFTIRDRRGMVALPLEARRNVFLIFKEALHNIVKHSGATQVEIAIDADGDMLILTITDNGRGFEGGGGTAGLGLGNMRSRASQLGGNFGIAGKPGGGTRITLSVKIP